MFEGATLQDLFRATGRKITGAYDLIAMVQYTTLTGVAMTSSEQTALLLNKAIGVRLLDTVIAPDVASYLANPALIMGHSTQAWWMGQPPDTQRRFCAAMQAGILRGESLDQLTARVLGTEAQGFADGVLTVSQHEAQILVRSSVQTVANSARLKAYESHPDLIKAVEWSAITDLRSSEICRALNGLQWSLPGYEPIGHDTPWPGCVGHPGCRSRQLAVTKSYQEITGRELPSAGNQTLSEAIAETVPTAGVKAEALIESAPAAGTARAIYYSGDWQDGRNPAEIEAANARRDGESQPHPRL